MNFRDLILIWYKYYEMGMMLWEGILDIINFIISERTNVYIIILEHKYNFKML
jgi:hypothetical protein